MHAGVAEYMAIYCHTARWLINHDTWNPWLYVYYIVNYFDLYNFMYSPVKRGYIIEDSMYALSTCLYICAYLYVIVLLNIWMITAINLQSPKYTECSPACWIRYKCTVRAEISAVCKFCWFHDYLLIQQNLIRENLLVCNN